MVRGLKSGSPWVWLTAGMVSLCLVAVLGVLLLIGWKGLAFFWPSPLYQFEIRTESGVEQVYGEIYQSRQIASQQLVEAGIKLDDPDSDYQTRLLVKIANRERQKHDFISVLAQDIVSRQPGKSVAVVERSEDGKYFGTPVGYLDNNQLDAGISSPEQFNQRVAEAQAVRDLVKLIERDEIGAVNYQIEQLRLQVRKLELDGQPVPDQLSEKRVLLMARYQALEDKLVATRSSLDNDALMVRDAKGETVAIPISRVLDVWYPNDMNWFEKIGHWGHQIAKFVSDDPREANSEGGVFPAIFGTVFMVLLMSVMVTPLGVMAAVYLHEYAGKNMFTRLIRIAVVNLAGVPSIVYGVFGLGFFIYLAGGTIDKLFYSEALPAPTFGTPGVLWSSLTLAILTLPVVIVSTEEGLSRIPSSVRHGSLALGATQAETLWRIVLPMASPAIMTGLILAIARAAGEVAPLMLVGVVKVAPSLPVDANFPFVHLDRKFMHLGYHIYDVGFQSPNIEAARPLVFATSFLLVTVIVGLNLTAIGIRNHLREKYRSLEQEL